jgi:hypothetical protein
LKRLCEKLGWIDGRNDVPATLLARSGEVIE